MRARIRLIRLRSLLPAALLLLLVAAAPAPPAPAQNPVPAPPLPSDAALADTVDRYLTIRTEMGGFSGAILIQRDGRVVLRKGYGWADVDKRVPYTPQTQHEVASVSKMFTAMAALRLRDEGKLALSDPICRFFPDCPKAWANVTVDQLIHHTSGIPDYEERLGLGSEKYLAFMTRPEASHEILANAMKDTLEFEPGARFHYSNTGYIVLSHVVERAAGMPFETYVRKTLLIPAGMTNSGMLGARPAPARLANGYTHGDLGWERVLAGTPLTGGQLQRVPALPLTPPEGDAWLYTTVDDLARWSRVMDGGGFVPKRECDEAFTPELEHYAAGWFVGEAYGMRRTRHNGSLPGYTTDFIKFPDAHVTILLFTNLDRTRLDRIARDVTAATFGRSFDLPIRGHVATLDSLQFARLTGTYRMSDGATLTIRKDPDLLAAAIPDRYVAGLIPLSPTEFYMPLGDGRTTFTLGADGRAERVNLRYGGDDHVAERVRE